MDTNQIVEMLKLVSGSNVELIIYSKLGRANLHGTLREVVSKADHTNQINFTHMYLSSFRFRKAFSGIDFKLFLERSLKRKHNNSLYS